MDDPLVTSVQRYPWYLNKDSKIAIDIHSVFWTIYGLLYPWSQDKWLLKEEDLADIAATMAKKED